MLFGMLKLCITFKVFYCTVELNCFLSAFFKTFLVVAQIMVNHLQLLVINCLITADCNPEQPLL